MVEMMEATEGAGAAAAAAARTKRVRVNSSRWKRKPNESFASNL
jgi:hypothetical protein|tara:strand:- start:1198 stop:1329 length:132 start_codon:yes stop_codon:yes gene_type:complete